MHPLYRNCPEEAIGREFQKIQVESGVDYDIERVLSNGLLIRMIDLYNTEEDTHWWYITNIPGG